MNPVKLLTSGTIEDYNKPVETLQTEIFKEKNIYIYINIVLISGVDPWTCTPSTTGTKYILDTVTKRHKQSVDVLCKHNSIRNKKVNNSSKLV